MKKKKEVMKKLIILLLVLVGSVMADEVWLNDRTVIKNCKIIDAGEKQIKVKVNLFGVFDKVFNNIKTYERDTVIKTIYKEIDPTQPTEFSIDPTQPTEFSDEWKEQRLNEKYKSIDKRVGSLEMLIGILLVIGFISSR